MAVEDKLVNLADLKTAYDTLTCKDEMIANKLYKNIFGDDSDWTKTLTLNSKNYTATKKGRTVTFTKGGSNTTWSWNTLTGTEHRMFTGNTDTAMTNIQTNGNDDFINISSLFETVNSNKDRNFTIVVNWYFVAKTLHSTAGNNTIAIYALFRSYNNETEQYDYSSFLSLGSKAFGSSLGDVHLTSFFAASDTNFRQNTLCKNLLDYEQVAIYVMRKAVSLTGTLTIEPCKVAFPFDKDYVRNGDIGIVTLWNNDGSASLSGQTMSKATNVYTLNSGTVSGSVYFRLDGTLGVVSTSGKRNDWAFPTTLKATAYTLTVEPISGTLTGSPNVAIYIEGNTSVASTKLTGGSVTFIWPDATKNAKIVTWLDKDSVVASNYTFRVVLREAADKDIAISVSGSTPTITAVAGCRYACSASAVEELSFTPPNKGVASVRFVSGSTATILTLPNTVYMPAWFDPNNLATNTTYEITIRDGVYGEVESWGADDAMSAVRYNGAQTLTDAQKAQARANIGAANVTVSGTTLIVS